MKHTILHADDDTMFSRMVKLVLEQGGFEVHNAYDGESAWMLFNKMSFDSCLLDIRMPGLNGIDLGERIRNADKEVPIIYLSGEDPVLVEKEVFGRGGGNGYVSKSFRMKDLKTLLNKHLDIHQKQFKKWI
ncbi:response regulator receiver domain-containing protein [Chitinophaga niastensis]|uniref:Response regulator receiver domain-containing protein n=1 Tax=Chitinophaga niastensis TaxID=536980 RepID=A0A2P8HTG7_CHINA|nr:response regulator [Chitinophaga niastensis]PSL49492.1 response regulator receiver domain-containing protein [Chitinophaga niastensis]